MKKLHNCTLAAVILLMVSGCRMRDRDDDHKAKLEVEKKGAPFATVPIPLSTSGEIPDIGPNQTLEFTLLGSSDYWVRFPNENPCTAKFSSGDGKTYQKPKSGPLVCETRKHLEEKHTYVLTWGPGTLQQTSPQTAIPYNAVKCRPVC